MQNRNNTSNKKLHSKRALWQRILASVLCVCLVVPMLNGVDLTWKMQSKSNIASAATAEEEQKARAEEYAKKFDLDDLKWSGATTENGSINYGNSMRTYLDWRTGSNAGMNQRNYIHVFAFEGDTICFGSNVFNSTLNESGLAVANTTEKQDIHNRFGNENATIDIVLIDLQGNRIPFDVVQNGAGHIPNVQTEVLAKTMETIAGKSGKNKSGKEFTYTPLTYKVKETGVYTFEFHSYDNSGTSGVTIKNDTVEKVSGVDVKNTFYDFYTSVKNNTTNEYYTPTDNDHGGLVAAWDISVFNEMDQKETGRVYADYLSLQQNGNSTIETYYVLTTDSYIYRWDWKGNAPYTYYFFTDNRGLIDNVTGNTIYKSAKGYTNNGEDYTKFGAEYKYPTSINTETSKTFSIFFEMPNTDLEGHLYSKALQPDPAEDIKFIDKVSVEGKEVPGAYQGAGGYFSFKTGEATTATLTLDFTKLKDEKGNPVSVSYAPVSISRSVTPHSINYFYWDGKDGNGEVIPKGKYNITDLITITTKAGEIHFPVNDLENAQKGFTFTRVSPIYDKNGERLDTPGSILDATKSVIYYDDSAIYYGEKIGNTDNTEADVRNDAGSYVLREHYKDMGSLKDDSTGKSNSVYFRYNNVKPGVNGNEYYIRSQCKDYVGGITALNDGVTGFTAEKFIRIGDHSHTTNKIEFYGEDGKFLQKGEFDDQMSMINYLDSAKYPVGVTNSNGETSVTVGNTKEYYYGSVSDYGLVNYWTFIPSQPVKFNSEVGTIDIVEGDSFNLSCQVFFDNNSNGIYDQMKDEDTLLSGITLRLYRKTADTSPKEGKIYYRTGSSPTKVNSSDTITTPRNTIIAVNSGTITNPQAEGLFELYREAITTVGGYVFSNIPYSDGDQFVYEVVRPNNSYVLTSGKTKGMTRTPSNGHIIGNNYVLYNYDTTAFGTEVQVITVGEQEKQINPKYKSDGMSNNYTRTISAIDVGYNYTTYKTVTLQKTWEAAVSTEETPVPVFELSYVDNENKTHVYEERPLAKIDKLSYSYPLLSNSINGKLINDWYVSAEYYIIDDVLYKQVFEYSPEAGDYSSFVGTCYKYTGEKITDQFSLPDTNEDGVSDWSDLAGITEWTVSTESKYHAVLDRILGTQEINISITNSEDPGIIEVLKYTGALEDKNYLQGATFRVYTNSDTEDPLTLEKVQAKIDSGTTEDLQWLADHQVGSSTTRTNGRVTFAGLDTKKHYIVREMYAPAGYRLMEALYMVHPYNCTEHKLAEGTSEVETEKWNMQNFFFDEKGYVQAAIANIPANGDMAIRKQIVGRAWNSEDSFSFDLTFWNGNNKLSFLSDTYNYPGAIEISEDELTILKASGGETTFRKALEDFIKAINDSENDVVVNYLCDFAKNVFSINGTKDIEESLVDTKQSVSLVVNAETDEDGIPVDKNPEDAILNTSKDTTTPLEHQIQNSHPFPAAGTYTFTIKENVPDNTGTMRYTGRVYTLVVEVTRMPIDGVVDGTTLNLGNSYLRAEVNQIYYQDPTTDGAEYPEDYGPKQIYAGVAPTFTNEYYVQPAKQSTSYAIEKQFSGRMDEDGNLLKDWLESDKFTIKIEGADDITKEALLNGNIFIGGLKEEAPYSESKTLVFTKDGVFDSKGNTLSKDDEKHLFRFDELDFRNLAFPVEWVFTEKAPSGYNIGDVVPKDENEDKYVVLYLDDARAKELGVYPGSYFVENLSAELTESNLYPVISRTQDIVYTLMISEENGSIAGVTYDTTKYKMVITLKNALNVSTSAGGLAEAVTDGIIDEIEINLYSMKGAEEDLKAYCKTDQHVVDNFDAWSNPEKYFAHYTTSSDNTATCTVYYVNSDGVIREAQITETDGSKKYEVFYSDALHEINATNFETYIKNGVTFIIKREEHSATNTHEMPFKNTYTETAKWTPKITKTINGRSWLETDSFKFTIEATSWPGYDGEHKIDGYELHKPKFTDNDIVVAYTNLTTAGGTTAEASMPEIEFNAPGTYTFTVTESSALPGGMNVNYGEVTLTVTVTSKNDGTLTVASVTAKDGEADITSSFIDISAGNVSLNFVNTYSETGTFHLYLTKTLKGRKWTDEEFTFIITPDTATLAAIGKQLKIPDSWTDNKDGTYSVTIKNDKDNSTDVTEELKTTPWTTRQLDLGELVVKTPREANEAYKFTIAEDTSQFASTEENILNGLDCAQPSINLQINAISDGKSAGDLTFTATFAAVGTDLPTATPTSEITLPFTNADTRLGTITVKKTVRDQPKDEKFSFTLKLTKPSSNLVLELSELEITLNGTAYTPTWTTSEDGNSFTLTFELGNGESLIIENVPYGTEYAVKEADYGGFHLQEVKDKDGNALALSFDGKGVIGSVSTDNKDVVLEFVNSRFYDMPFTGGAGVHPWVILGIMLMVLPPTVYLFYRKRRNKEFAKSFKK